MTFIKKISVLIFYAYSNWKEQYHLARVFDSDKYLPYVLILSHSLVCLGCLLQRKGAVNWYTEVTSGKLGQGLAREL